MTSLKRLLLGVAFSPKVVAAARALLLYGVPILITLFAGWANTITDPRFYGIALLCVPLVRAIGEGILDQANRPQMNAIDPPKVAGGADPNVFV